MCTITIEDNLVEQLRPALGADSDVKDWIQRQIELAVLQYVQQLKSKSMRQESIRRIKAIAEADGSTLSLRDFEGILIQESQPNTSENSQPIPDVVLRLLGAGLPLDDDDLNGRKAYYQHLEEKHQ